MTILRTLLKTGSIYNKTLPFAYYAKVSPVRDDNTFLQHYFAETICGIIRLMDKKEIPPSCVSIFGAYTQTSDKLIKVEFCTNEEGEWLTEEETCDRFEQLYKKTQQEQFKGCVKTGECMFNDRNRNAGDGPF